jgi:SAM-dependent methyltransferase
VNELRGVADPGLVAREYASLERLRMRRVDRTGWIRFDDLNEEQILQTAVAEVRPARVLDVGCGSGRLAATLAVQEVVCVDSSPAAVAAAGRRGLAAEVADAQELPFEDGSFDVVLCNHVLYHVPDQRRALRELRRVLRPGGRFVGIYNGTDHLREVWDAVGATWAHDRFDAETGLPLLEQVFARVERRLCGGAVVWLAQADLQAYLDAFSVLLGQLEAPAEPYPFFASRSKCVFVAEAA